MDARDLADLADLPFAAALTAHQGGMASGAEYDGVHFDQISFDGPRASGSRFIECAFTGVSFQGGGLQRARFSDVWMRDGRLVTTSLAQTQWLDVVIDRSLAAGVEAFGAEMRRVTFRGCKLDSVNFREAVFTEVTFDNCELRDVDFMGASLIRTAFPDSRLTRTDLSRVRMEKTDLRGAELGIIIGPDSLRGATISTGQLILLAPLLAETMGIVVSDD
jgi:uncharacterized protein YjbI with pentapeptide repeats